MQIYIHQLSIVVMILKLLYDATVTKIRVKHPVFSLSDPYNSTEHEPVDDVYEKLIDFNNFTFINNSELCQNLTTLLLVIIISSKPTNYDRRTAIRNTWGRSDCSTKVVFLIGETDSMISQNIKNETALFRDIVHGSFIDSYRTMTYKHVMGLKWVTYHCPMARYVLKTDDDVFVHIQALRHFLTRELSPWGAKRLIMCHVLKGLQPQRTYNFRWRVLPEEYSEEFYPPYCLGYIILYSQDVVSLLLKAAQSSPYFWIDDVHLTGIMAKKINLKLTSGTSLFLRTWHKDGDIKKLLFGRINTSVEEMIIMWSIVSE